MNDLIATVGLVAIAAAPQAVPGVPEGPAWLVSSGAFALMLVKGVLWIRGGNGGAKNGHGKLAEDVALRVVDGLGGKLDDHRRELKEELRDTYMALRDAIRDSRP